MKHIIYNEDCKETIKRLLEEGTSIDLILSSPPYNMTKRKGGYADKCKRYDVYEDWKTEKDYIDWTVDMFNGFNKVVCEKGVVLWNFSYSIENPSLPYTLVSEILKRTNFSLVDTIIWRKSNGVPFPANKHRLSRIWEYVFVFCKKGQENDFNIYKPVTKIAERTGQAYYSVFYNIIEAKNNDGANDLNKATYSSDFVLKLLSIYANKDTVLYDPFMGTGTTSIGGIRRGVKECIGSEISSDQCEFANKRILEYREG